MKHKRRVALLLLLPLALAAAAAGAILMLPAERIAALAADRAEAALEREVRIERVSLDVFPAPAVSLEGVAVGGATPEAPPLATVRRVLLRPRLLPLLWRRVVVDAVVLEQPRLLVEVDSTGALNLPELGEGERGGGGDIAFGVERFQIEDGRLAYRDRRSGVVVGLDGLSQRLRLAGDVRGGKLSRIELEGELEVAALSAALPGKLAVPVRDVRLRVVHRAVLDRASDSLRLEKLAVELQDLALEGEGTVRRLSAPEAREVAVRLAAGPFDVGELVRSLPRALLERAGPGGRAELPEVDGRARMRVAAEGRLGAGELPAVQGTVELERFALAYPGLGPLVTDLGGSVAFSLDSVASPGLSGRLLGQPLRLAFAVQEPAAPVGRLSIRTVLDLERARELGVVPDSIEAGGRVGLDLAVRAPLLEPARGVVDGRVGLQGVRLRTPGLELPVVVEAGGLEFAGREIRSRGVRLRAGESDVALDLAVSEWLPLALGDSAAAPKATFDVRARRLDLDGIFGVPDSTLYSQLFFARLAGRPVGGRPVEEVAKEAGLGLPELPPVELQGRLRAAELRRNGLELRDVDVSLSGRGDRLELTDARFQLMGGGVQIAGRIGMAAGSAGAERRTGYPAALTFQLRDVGAAAFFDRFTPFRGHLSGSLLLAGRTHMVLDEYLLPLRESVTAEGTAAVSAGRLANWPALRALGRQLGIARFDTLAFRDWTGAFQVAGPRVALRESYLEAGEMHVRAAGSFDVSGELDLAATAELAPSLAARVRGALAPRLARAAAGPEGRIPVGVRITGPAREPDLRLDLSAAASNAVAEARKEAEARARELAGKAAREAAEKAAGQLLPRDSVPLAADSARAKLEGEMKKRLCRFVKCG